MIDNERFRAVVEYLKINRLIRNQQDLAERVGLDKATISQVMHNKIVVSKKLRQGIVKAFPFISHEWLETGDGEMLKSVITQNVSGGENITQLGVGDIYSGKAIYEIAAQRKMTEQALERLKVSQQQISDLIEVLKKI